MISSRWHAYKWEKFFGARWSMITVFAIIGAAYVAKLILKDFGFAEVVLYFCFRNDAAKQIKK